MATTPREQAIAEVGALLDRLQRQARVIDLFSSAPDLICIADEQHFIFVNRAWTLLLGWTEDELTARPWLDFVHPEDIPRTRQAMAEMVHGRLRRQIVNRYQSKFGEWVALRWVHASAWHDGVTHAVAVPVGPEEGSAAA